MDALIRGFELSIIPINLVLMVAGTGLGILIGALPGLGPTTGIALLIPLTFGMEASSALLLASGIYMGAIYGGSITSILLGIPGTPTNAATVFDGYPLSRQGRCLEAQGASLVASAVGGLFSSLCLMFLTPLVSRSVLYFGASEQFMLAIFGLSVIALSSKESFLKGLLGGFLGLAISTVGFDAITGYNRFNFDIVYLDDGIPFMAMVVGLFGLSQAITLAEEATTIATDTKLTGSVGAGAAAVFKHWWLTVRSSLIGMFFGIVPGVGGSASAMLAYSFAERNAPDRDTFGKGNIKGVIAPEASNNGTVGTALIPTLAFGIPGSPTAAVMMGLLMIHNILPGPRLFQDVPDTLYTFFWGLIYTCFVMVIIAWPLIRVFSKVTLVPYQVLVPSIVMLCVLGAFSIRGYIFDVFVTIAFGFLGYFLRKAKYPMVCIVLGLVLGAMTEANLSRSLMIYGDLSFLWTRPLTLALVILTVLILVLPYVNFKKVKALFGK
jgi:putative tricarboxylic transport membrane protein